MRQPDALWPIAQAYGASGRLLLGAVTNVDDPDSRGRIEVAITSLPGDGPTHAWAQVLVPFAGDQYGAWLVPGVGEQVLLGFMDDDPRRPVVLGALWHGSAAPADAARNGDIRSWELRGREGTRVSLIEEPQSSVEVVTAQGVKLTLSDESGGLCKVECAGTTITVDTQGVRIETPGRIEAQATRVQVTAATVNVDTAMATFSGVVKCEVLQASSVISASYTPGAGNIW